MGSGVAGVVEVAVAVAVKGVSNGEVGGSAVGARRVMVEGALAVGRQGVVVDHAAMAGYGEKVLGTVRGSRDGSVSNSEVGGYGGGEEGHNGWVINEGEVGVDG